jgi:hypothetical protein
MIFPLASETADNTCEVQSRGPGKMDQWITSPQILCDTGDTFFGENQANKGKWRNCSLSNEMR